MCYAPHVNDLWHLGVRNGVSEPDRLAKCIVETSSGMTMS
jgi:hypothetical protein